MCIRDSHNIMDSFQQELEGICLIPGWERDITYSKTKCVHLVGLSGRPAGEQKAFSMERTDPSEVTVQQLTDSIDVYKRQTYIIPAGQFDVNPETKALITGKYHAVEQTPVNLWNSLRNIFTGMTNSAKVRSIVIFMGGALKVIISTGAVEEFLNWAIYKLQKKGIAVIVPLMVILF